MILCTLVDGYIYDSNRLIFYNENLDPSDIEKIDKYINENSDSEKLKNKIEAHNADSVDVNLIGLSRVGICLTNGCNLRCNYCGDNASDENTASLELDDILFFVTDVMKRWKIRKLTTKKEDPLDIYFTGGGEPSYKWELFEQTVLMVKRKCDENHIPLSLGITTNGMLTEYQRDFIAEHFNKIMLSFDGLPKIQNKNRHSKLYPDTSSVAEHTIESLVRKKVQFTIRTTIWQDDFCYMKNMAEYIFDKFGESSFEWSILPVIPMGRALKRVRRDHEILKEGNFLEYYLDTLEYVKNTYGSRNISTPIFPNSLTSIYCGALAYNCSCPWLLPNKTIVTCLEACNSKTVIGRIEDNKIKYFDKCCDKLLKIYQEKFTECQNCIAYRFCRGGCPAKHLICQEEESEMSDWECSMIQKYWTYIFSKILTGETCFGWKTKRVDIDEIKRYNVLELDRVDGNIR